MTAELPRILVVDDLEDWRKTLKGLLEDEGYFVAIAGSANEATTYLNEEHFDVAVLDIRLDETEEDNIEGVRLAEEIKRNWPEVQIIMITGHSAPNTIESTRRPDAIGKAEYYMLKADTLSLIERIDDLLAIE